MSPQRQSRVYSLEQHLNAHVLMLKDEIELTKAESDKLLDRLQAITEECDMRIAQVKKDVYEFRREIVIGGESARTGKIVAEKVIRYFEEKLRAKVRVPVTFRRTWYPAVRTAPLQQPTCHGARCPPWTAS